MAGSRAAAILPALLLLFTASGLSGLVYEVVWLRYLTLVFGVTIYAVSTVLSAFMGGLALGGFLAGRVADDLRRPLRVYGAVELGIGLTALLTPSAFSFLSAVYRSLYPAVPHTLTALSLVRFVLACVILIVPTTLMGATLPIVVRSSLRRVPVRGKGGGSLGSNVSLLYGCNTAGGIAGAYLAGFVLIGSAGVHATMLTAAALNLSVGVGAMLLDAWSGEELATARTPRERAVPPARSEPSPRAATPILSDSERNALRWLLAAFFVSGLTSLGYQVIWTRLLAIFFEATTYAFNIILCTFLLGLAAGSYLVTPLINRRARWLLVAAIMEWAVALMAVYSLAAIGQLNQLIDRLRYVPLADHLVSGEQRATALMAVLTMFPTTLLLGAAFPIVLRLYSSAGVAGNAAEGSPLIGRRLGRAYAANVCGSIVGSWATGFVLIPLLGTQRSLWLLAGLTVVVSLGLLRAAWPRRFPVLAPLAALVVLGAGALTPNVYGAVFSRFGDPVLWYEEGLEQTVTILQGPTLRRMFLNGWHQADDSDGTVRFHALIGHLPLLIEPSPSPQPQRDVLVIGLGGGVTAGAAASYDGASVDVVELSSSVVRGARFFDAVNERVVDAPNAHYRTDDGRNYLLLTSRKYDAIMADVVQPQHAGSAALYSAEYYRLARGTLKEQGVMVQWIDRRLPANQYKLLLRTFLQEFPYVTAWVDGAFVVGSRQPYQLDRQLIDQRLGGSAHAAAVRIGLVDSGDVLGLFTAADDELRSFVGDGPIVTDDHPYIEFFHSLPHDAAPADLSSLSHNPSAIVR